MDWSTVVGGAANAVINGIAVFLAVRYTGRLVEKVEKKDKKNEK